MLPSKSLKQIIQIEHDSVVVHGPDNFGNQTQGKNLKCYQLILLHNLFSNLHDYRSECVTALLCLGLIWAKILVANRNVKDTQREKKKTLS